jgi:hypothetical protein
MYNSATGSSNWFMEQAFLKHSRKYILNRVRMSARRRKIECNIELSDIVIPEKCPYLDVLLDSIRTCSSYAPSVDRIDNKRGYVKGNIQVISLRANKMKNDASKEELLAFAKGIIKLNRKKSERIIRREYHVLY